MTVKAMSSGIQLVSDVSGKLPVVKLDRDRILQVLYNLIGNAIKFSEVGQEVHLKTLVYKNFIRVEVIDQAGGIKKEDLPKLFKSFSQVGQSSQKRKHGSGLGLAISKDIITGLGGDIDVLSEFGKGSTFYFILPIIEKRRLKGK